MRVVTGADKSPFEALPMGQTWQIHLGDYASGRLAQDAINTALSLTGLEAQNSKVQKTARGYGARLHGLDARSAQKTCAGIFEQNGPRCFLIAPSG